MKVPQKENASIVAIGSFNPAIFQPLWLGVQQLIRTEEAESAKITTIQPEIADFETEWFHLQVLSSRFLVSTADPRQYEPLSDLAASIFTMLPHTPVNALGLNRTFSFEMPSIEAWHKLGHLLAPKEHWDEIMDGPGLRSMLMQGRRKNANGGVMHIKVEPTPALPNSISIDFNEEFRAPPESGSSDEHWVLDHLRENWSAIMNYAEEAAQHLLGIR